MNSKPTARQVRQELSDAVAAVNAIQSDWHLQIKGKKSDSEEVARIDRVFKPMHERAVARMRAAEEAERNLPED